jgi:glyoxylase-like metal-dependent hydrolase (beta-lactamase superfamily II)
MKRSVLLGILLAAGAASMTAQTPAAPKVIDILKLKDNLYVLTSSTPGNAAFSGGNVAVFITGAGVTLVDDKLAGWGQAVLDKVKSVTDKPITRIINTHTHGDHTGNNGFFGANVEIVAQERTKANMEKMDAFKGDNAKFLPSKTFTDKLTIGSGKDRIDLYYFGAGHTSGDLFVVFPALRVLHTGDDFAWKDGPLCDRNNGGSIKGAVAAMNQVIALAKPTTKIVPGPFFQGSTVVENQ